MEIKKILFLGASPKNIDHIQTNKEYQTIRTAVNNAADRKYKVVSHQNVTNDIIQDTIIEEKPTIVHFSGHGTENFLITHHNNDYGLEDQMNNDSFVKIIERAKSITCVVLNCCYSKTLAEKLIKIDHVKAVIGTSDKIKNEACLKFAKGFYLSISNGYSFEEAFEDGKNKITINQVSGASLLKYHGKLKTPTPVIPNNLERKRNSTPFFIGIVLLFLCGLGFWLFNMSEEIIPEKEINSNVKTPPIPFKKDSLYGYKINDSITINPKFHAASEFKNDSALVSVVDSTYYIDTKEKWLKSERKYIFNKPISSVKETKYVKKSIPNCSRCKLEGWFSVDKDGNIIDFKPNSKISLVLKGYSNNRILGYIKPSELSNFSFTLKWMICEPREEVTGTSKGELQEYLFSVYKNYQIKNSVDIIAFHLCKGAAEYGHPKAQNNLAVMYEKGVSSAIPINYHEAYKWYLKAAKQGLPEAQKTVGLCYKIGKGTIKNKQEAIKWILKAAQNGNTHSEYLIGTFYETGDIVTQDFDKATAWYKKAASKGLPEAKSRLDSISKSH